MRRIEIVQMRLGDLSPGMIVMVNQGDAGNLVDLSRQLTYRIGDSAQWTIVAGTGTPVLATVEQETKSDPGALALLIDTSHAVVHLRETVPAVGSTSVRSWNLIGDPMCLVDVQTRKAQQ